jgi:hypothetical protein
MHWPPVAPPSGAQIEDGRHWQLGVPAQAAGNGAQNGAGGVQGGGTQPGSVPLPGGHWGS